MLAKSFVRGLPFVSAVALFLATVLLYCNTNAMLVATGMYVFTSWAVRRRENARVPKFLAADLVIYLVQSLFFYWLGEVHVFRATVQPNSPTYMLGFLCYIMAVWAPGMFIGEFFYLCKLGWDKLNKLEEPKAQEET